MQMVGKRFVTEMFGASTGTPAKVDPAWLGPAPSGAMFVFTTALDGAGIAKLLRAKLATDESSPRRSPRSSRSSASDPSASSLTSVRHSRSTPCPSAHSGCRAAHLGRLR
jgi:hypothetical protein